MEQPDALVGPGGKVIAMNLLSPLGNSVLHGRLKKEIVYWGLHLPGVGGFVVPLLDLCFVQFARWVIIPKDKFPHLSPEQPREELAHDYLLFNSNYNGQWDQYLDAFSAVYDWGVNAMWEGSEHWVDAQYTQGLKQFVTWSQIRRGNVPADYYYAAYPEAALSDIRAALDLRDALESFRAATPAAEAPADFVRRWRELFRQAQGWLMSTGPAPVDGDLLAAQDPDAGNLALGIPERPPSQFPRPGGKARKTPWLVDFDVDSTLSPKNTWGQAYGLTLLTPIKPGREHVEAIRAFLAGLPIAAESPFHRSSATHTARWVILDGLPGEAEGTSLDRLKSRYLLFDANFDTDAEGLDGYLRDLSGVLEHELEAIYSHCVDFKRAADFPAYAERCQITSTFFFSDYAQKARGKAPKVIRALAIQRAFVELAVAMQALERPLPPARRRDDAAAAMQATFTSFIRENLR